MTTTADTDDAMPGDGVAEDINHETSLRSCIQENNALMENGVIGFWITTPPPATITLTRALPSLDFSYRIINDTPSYGITITRAAGAPAFRIFTVTGTRELRLANLTISNGAAGVSGGGIYNSGRLFIDGCTITGNSAASGGGIFSNGTLNITTSQITANSSTGDGGGILIDGGVASISGSDLLFNTAAGEGGGISISPLTGAPVVTIGGCQIDSNTAQFGGGGISAESGSLTVTNSTVSSNDTPLGNGGGLDLSSHTDLLNVTISGNTAPVGSGGGVYLAGQTATRFSIGGGSIDNNIAGDEGGGFYMVNGDLGTSQLTIQDNFSSGKGGGFAIADGIAGLDFLQFNGNTSDTKYFGGAISAGVQFKIFSLPPGSDPIAFNL